MELKTFIALHTLFVQSTFKTEQTKENRRGKRKTWKNGAKQ